MPFCLSFLYHSPQSPQLPWQLYNIALSTLPTLSSTVNARLTHLQATGNVGSEIYKALKSSPANFNITILSRPDSKSKQPEGAKVIQYDYNDPALVDALRGQDAIIVAVSAMVTISQVPLIDAAIKAGVKKFVPAEVSEPLPIIFEILWNRHSRSRHLSILVRSCTSPLFRRKEPCSFGSCKQHLEWGSAGCVTSFPLGGTTESLLRVPADVLTELHDVGGIVQSCCPSLTSNISSLYTNFWL